ncbi:MAG: enoyl-CoA hydratase/carnithine racemase [Kangiellaceae bacterium]|jgi:enoyl-CoA hydratase/carnithine racemase
MIHELLENNILTIVMDRIDKKNALVPKMYSDMAIAIENAPLSNARVVVIKGAGGCFTAGNDVTEFLRSVKDGAGEINETYQFMHALMHCSLPVVAQVEDLAIGIGSTMLLHCDFVLCHENTKFSMPFINLGLVPEYASSYIVPRVAGHLKAAELLMLGNPFNAKQAKNCGFVTSIHSVDLDAAVVDIAQALAKKPALALQQTKALLKQDSSAVAQHIDDELKIFVEAMQSDAANEAFTAFVEKRSINYDKFK